MRANLLYHNLRQICDYNATDGTYSGSESTLELPLIIFVFVLDFHGFDLG